MDADREKKLTYIKDEIKQGKYRVDPKLVAEAILLRLTEIAAAGSRLPRSSGKPHTPPQRH